MPPQAGPPLADAWPARGCPGKTSWAQKARCRERNVAPKSRDAAENREVWGSRPTAVMPRRRAAR